MYVVAAFCSSDQECALDEACVRGQCANPCAGKGACGMNALCSVANHLKLCACPPGFTGKADVECVRVTCRVHNDCFLGHICLNNMCIFGCTTNDDCTASEACVEHRCADPCAASPCGPNALCAVSNQRASCSCRDGFVPSPTAQVACVRAPAQPCSENRECGAGQACHEGACRPLCAGAAGCLASERCVADAGVCKPVCRRDDDCRRGE
ncbi:Putative dumpy, partial [Gryllus bimaculatus]